MNTAPVEMLPRRQPLLLPKKPAILSSLDNSRQLPDSRLPGDRFGVENDENATGKKPVYKHYKKIPPPRPPTDPAARWYLPSSRQSPENRENGAGNQEFSFVTHSFTKENERLRANRHIDHPKTGGKLFSVPMKHTIGRPKIRMTPEQLRLLSRRIDPTQPLTSPNMTPAKPPLPILYCPSPRRRSRLRFSQNVEPRKKPSVLYQTCQNLWHGPRSLGDLSYDNIRAMSELLKVRLQQAKYRVIAKMEADGTCVDNELYNSLKTDDDCSSWPTSSPRSHKVNMSTKRHKPSLSLRAIGNGRNIFKQTKAFRKEQNQKKLNVMRALRNGAAPLRVSPLKCSQENRKEKPPPPAAAATRQDISPKEVELTPKSDENSSLKIQISAKKPAEDTPVFVCEACNKRYKNKNGLQYHLDRCTLYNKKNKDGVDGSVIDCICNTPNEDEGTMVQCDTCRCWLHVSCIGLHEKDFEDDYNCPRCRHEDLPTIISRGGKIGSSEVARLQRQRDKAITQMNHESEAVLEEGDDIDAMEIEDIEESYNENDDHDGDEKETLKHHSIFQDLQISPIQKPRSGRPHVGDSIACDFFDVPVYCSTLTERSMPSLSLSENSLGSLVEEQIATPSSVFAQPDCPDCPVQVQPPDLTSFMELETEQDTAWMKFANFDDDFIC